MLSTCNEGCESFAYLLYFAKPLLSFIAFTFGPLKPGYNYLGPANANDSNLCKCSTVGYSLISACGGCQGANWITYDPCCFSSQLPELMYMPLVGQNSRPTAQGLCLPPRKDLSCRESIGFEIDDVAQVPQPYPFRNTCSPLGSP